MSILTGQPTTPEERARISSMGNRLKARQPVPAGDLAALIEAAIERAVQRLQRQAPAESAEPSNVVPLPPRAIGGNAQFKVQRDATGDIVELKADSGLTYRVQRDAMGEIAAVTAGDAVYNITRDGFGDVVSISRTVGRSTR